MLEEEEVVTECWSCGMSLNSEEEIEMEVCQPCGADINADNHED